MVYYYYYGFSVYFYKTFRKQLAQCSISLLLWSHFKPQHNIGERRSVELYCRGASCFALSCNLITWYIWCSFGAVRPAPRPSQASTTAKLGLLLGKVRPVPRQSQACTTAKLGLSTAQLGLHHGQVRPAPWQSQGCSTSKLSLHHGQVRPLHGLVRPAPWQVRPHHGLVRPAPWPRWSIKYIIFEKAAAFLLVQSHY